MSARRLDPAWWAPALALHERAGDVAGAHSGTGEDGRSRLAGWRGRYGDAEAFGHRLAHLDLDQTSLLALLEESAEALAARIDRPGWVETVEDAVAAAPATPPHPPAEWDAAFACPLRPLIATVTGRIGHLRQSADAAGIDLDAITAHFTARLTQLLVRLAAPTLVTELHARRDAGTLRGADGAQRFADFVRGLSDADGLAGFFGAYPVLARILAQTTEQRTDALVEVLTRFIADRAEIVTTILAGVDPGPLKAITGDVGDVHQRGRSVQMLSFADGSTVVYKPRGVAAQLCLADLIEWLNKTSPDLGLETVPLVSRGDHGWMAFVANTEAAGRLGVADFYRRLGALLAVLHMVRATDMHYQNVIAWGDQPVLVDAETLFHPVLAAAPIAGDPAAYWLATSVARTGILPSMQLGNEGGGDVSAIGCDVRATRAVAGWEDPGTDRMRPGKPVAGQVAATNRPRLADETFDPCEFTDVFLQGFRDGYNAIARYSTDFLELMRRYFDIDTRVVVRPTRGYIALLEESYQPGCMRDALERDQVFDALWTASMGDPMLGRLAAHEVVDLWAGDVPLFYGRPGRDGLRTFTGTWMESVLQHGHQWTEATSSLGEPDRQDQEWVILASIATLAANPDHRGGGGSRQGLWPIAAQPDHLLAAACSIADQLVGRAFDNAERVNWLGLELIDNRQWMVLPMGAGLANGYLGVALLLAQLYKLTGIGRYADTANRVAEGYTTVHRLLTEHPALAAAVGGGGLHGLGGIAYGLSRLAVLLDNAQAARMATETIHLSASVMDQMSKPHWDTGLAGLLAAATAVHRDLSLPAAHALAMSCADRLVREGSDRFGFVDGRAGIAFALCRTGEARHLEAARTLLTSLGGQRMTGAGWCSGLSGRLIAQLTITPQLSRTELIQAELSGLAERPVTSDLSLCHGELGIADTLIYLGQSEAVPHRAGLILDAIRRYGPTCSTPMGVPTPGLLHGLAGIGYGLLRLGYPAHVPSALLLESDASLASTLSLTRSLPQGGRYVR